jgi:hypothetical protein
MNTLTQAFQAMGQTAFWPLFAASRACRGRVGRLDRAERPSRAA